MSFPQSRMVTRIGPEPYWDCGLLRLSEGSPAGKGGNSNRSSALTAAQIWLLISRPSAFGGIWP
jgi:hypothetical protein